MSAASVSANGRVSPKLMPGNFRRLAKKGGMRPEYVSRVLRGRRGMSLERAAEVANIAGVTLDELFAHLTYCKLHPQAVEAVPEAQ